jgi:hypothetical protein
MYTVRNKPTRTRLVYASADHMRCTTAHTLRRRSEKFRSEKFRNEKSKNEKFKNEKSTSEKSSDY